MDIWTIGSGPVSSSQYLKDIASSSEQSSKSIFFENLSPLITTITQKLCSGEFGLRTNTPRGLGVISGTSNGQYDAVTRINI